jgi:hypothetical protein
MRQAFSFSFSFQKSERTDASSTKLTGMGVFGSHMSSKTRADYTTKQALYQGIFLKKILQNTAFLA